VYVATRLLGATSAAAASPAEVNPSPMDLPKKGLDPRTLELIARALDAACEEIVMANYQANATALRALMAGRIMAAVRDGERNAEVPRSWHLRLLRTRKRRKLIRD
jgi:hypothetical protein